MEYCHGASGPGHSGRRAMCTHPFSNYYQEERLCTINSSTFPNVTILSFKVYCLIWTLLNVELSMFPIFMQSTKHLI